MRVLCALTALLCLAESAAAKVNSADLTQWLPELPPYTNVSKRQQARELDHWLQHVHPGMSVSQVIVLMGKPDWGVDHHGRLRWVIDPKDGAVQYSSSGRDGYKSGDRKVRIYFDSQARVKRIEDNGVVIAKGRRAFLPDPLPRGVWWRP
jgi:outer membrane protein assembly factor BamE (lipoprotein component of BamABCDE complex)